MPDTLPDVALDSLTEAGLPVPEPKQEDRNLPPGDGNWLVRQFETFASQFGGVNRTYRWTFDEALKNSRTNAMAMRRDAVIMDALRSRQMPVAQLGWHLEAVDPLDLVQAEQVQVLTRTIEQIPNFQRMKMQLLEADWFGRYAVQCLFRWDFSMGRKRLVVRDHVPINGDKLVFKWGGRVGVLVHGSYRGDTVATDRGKAHFFTPYERESLIVHKFEPEDADFYAGEMSGAIHGIGIRSRIYWAWWMRSQLMAWMLDYMERVGAGGFTIYYYLAGNKESLTEVKTSIEQQVGQNVILFPRYLDTKTGGPGIERIEPGVAGVQVLMQMIQGYFDDVMRRYILGQDLTSGTASTGLGSGVADLHADTFSRIVKYDAIALQETLTEDLVRVLAKYTFPGVPAPRFVFDLDVPNATEILSNANTLFSMGAAIDADELRKISGLAKPAPGSEILSMAQQQPEPEEGEEGDEEENEEPEDVALFNRRGERIRYAAKSLPMNATILGHVRSYMQSRGQKFDETPLEYEEIDPQQGMKIADQYTAASHNPDAPHVKGSYDAFKSETLAQFHHLVRQGVKFDFVDSDPYKSSAEMMADAQKGRLKVFRGGDMPHDHPLRHPTGVLHNGQMLSHNDVFRAVHDYFGHALHGNGFGPRGEHHAWRSHARMYSNSAKPAMTAETRGQNSWVNFGPHMRDESGALRKEDDPKHLKAPQRPFAEQKATVMKYAKTSKKGSVFVPTQPEDNDTEALSRMDKAVQAVDEKTAPHRVLIGTEKRDKGDMAPSIDELGEELGKHFVAHTIREGALDSYGSNAKSWYRDDLNAHSEMIEKIADTHPALKGTFKPGSARSTLWKMLLVPTSFAQNPIVNTTVAWKVLQAGIKENPDSPFSAIPGRSEDGKWWGPKQNPKHFEYISKLVQDLGEEGAAKWLTTKHSTEEIRKYKPKFSGVYGDKAEYYGGHIFGPKGGAFAANLTGDEDELTKDVWFTRSWYRLFEGLTGRSELPALPKSNHQRRLMDKAVQYASKKLGLSVATLQAVWWYHEQDLWRQHGHVAKSYSYRDGAERLAKSVAAKVDEASQAAAQGGQDAKSKAGRKGSKGRNEEGDVIKTVQDVKKHLSKISSTAKRLRRKSNA